MFFGDEFFGGGFEWGVEADVVGRDEGVPTLHQFDVDFVDDFEDVCFCFGLCSVPSVDFFYSCSDPFHFACIWVFAVVVDNPTGLVLFERSR